jgi:hypothetical protein
MPLHPNVRRCTHIQLTGHRCGSPALKQEYFCYFHTRMIKGVQTRVDSQIHPVALIESAEAIQAALMHMIDAVLKGTIDNKRATLVLKALYIAARNSRNVYFSIRQDDMTREVPNYAQQYLSEHPELNSPEPRGDSRLGCPAEQSSAASNLSLRAEDNSREKASPETGKEECHPERAPKRESKDPHPANGGKGATGNSHHPSERDRQKARPENTPPLTSRQSERWNEIRKLEASIEKAMRGDWRELRTVFNAVGFTPPHSRPRKAKPSGISKVKRHQQQVLAGSRQSKPTPSVPTSEQSPAAVPS